MISRGTLIAALLVVELAIAGEAIVAVQGGQFASLRPQRSVARTFSGPHLIEGGPHQIFAAGEHPTLTVDIGYADLTILTGNASRIDVSLSPSADGALFQETSAITAQAHGETIRVEAGHRHELSTGDDRMVTIVVPSQTQVTVVNAGDIRASGLRAESSFNSIGRGSITVDDFNAPALHVSSKGRIGLHQIVATRLDAVSSDDRIEGTALQVRDGNVQSDELVTLGFATGADTLVMAQTSNGKVSLSGFPPAAELAPSSKRSEDEDNDSSSQTVRIGAGNGHLDVHSSEGNITLDQEG